jgi:hypothetical protein
MNELAFLTLGIFPILLGVFGLILAIIWIILPFRLIGLCNRVERLEWYIAKLHEMKVQETTRQEGE